SEPARSFANRMPMDSSRKALPPYECEDFSVKISFSRINGGRRARRPAFARPPRGNLSGGALVDEWTGRFSRPPRQRAPHRAIRPAVDNGGHVDKDVGIFAVTRPRERARRSGARGSGARGQGPA